VTVYLTKDVLTTDFVRIIICGLIFIFLFFVFIINLFCSCSPQVSMTIISGVKLQIVKQSSYLCSTH